jgi:hypothetical protein
MKIAKVVFALTLLYFFSACSPISKTIRDSKVLGNTDGLVKVDTKEKVIIYKRPGFNIGRYNKFRIDPVRSKVTNKEMVRMTPVERKNLGQYLRSSVMKELGAGGYGVTFETAPDILGIQFTLTDVDSGNPYLNVLQFHPMGVSLDIGGVTIESEFYDTSNNQVNAIAVVGAEGARKFNISSVNGQWGDVKKIFDEWAKGFRKRLDEKRAELRN